MVSVSGSCTRDVSTTALCVRAAVGKVVYGCLSRLCIAAPCGRAWGLGRLSDPSRNCVDCEALRVKMVEL
jgi:hypothetical protein